MVVPHILIFPFPAQGHVTPFLALSQSFVDHGFKVTFVNTHFYHDRVLASLSMRDADELQGIRMVSIPDGMSPGEDRSDIAKLVDGLSEVLPDCLPKLIAEANNDQEGADMVSWIIVDVNLGWALNVAKKMGIRAAAYSTASAASLALMLSIPKLVQDGVLQANGLPQRDDDAVDDDENFELCPGMAPIKTSQFPWNCVPYPEAQKTIYQIICKNMEALDSADFIICNSFHELESHVCLAFPNIVPIGPLLAGERQEKPAVCHFWQEDSSSVKWLDEQAPSSVIYIAFGSFAMFQEEQFKELAIGLELTGRPFLWIVRPNSIPEELQIKPWLDGFRQRIAGRGMITGWCPQQQVLAHPALSCFVSHCGWNSVMEGVMNGVPFLCWPYFTEQFLNQSYICNIWKNGLSIQEDHHHPRTTLPRRFEGAAAGFCSRVHVKDKLEELIGDEKIKARALLLKDTAHGSISSQGGSSYNNFKSFVEAMKQ